MGERWFISFECLANILDSQNEESWGEWKRAGKRGRGGGRRGYFRPSPFAWLPLPYPLFCTRPKPPMFPYNPRWRLINSALALTTYALHLHHTKYFISVSYTLKDNLVEMPTFVHTLSDRSGPPSSFLLKPIVIRLPLFGNYNFYMKVFQYFG